MTNSELVADGESVADSGMSEAGMSVSGMNQSGRSSPGMGDTPQRVPLADVREAMLDDEELRALLSDIATYGTVRELTIKSSPRARPDVVARLPEVYLKLVQRRVYGAQLRYEFEGAVWLDTLIATPDGLRLVRVELPR